MRPPRYWRADGTVEWERRARVARRQREAWQRGPCLENGHIVVPSPYYCGHMAQELRRAGFVYTYRRWKRPLDRPARNGKRYSPEQWLETARRLYRRIFPEWELAEEGGEPYDN